jgi:osmotically-inducible protein OsmY
MILILSLAVAAVAQRRSDASILSDLQRRIRITPEPNQHVSISVLNGVVTLTGAVPTFAQKMGIIGIAQRTVGVISIVDSITVVPLHRQSDADIISATRQALVGNLSDADMTSVKITAQNGVVVLSGTVTSSYSKQIAGILAGWILGVVDVQNNIVVHPTQARSDFDILADIENQFAKSAFIQAQRISVSVTDGVVTLSGRVDDYLIADQAEAIAQFTQGVVAVRNQLYVDRYPTPS